MLVVRLTLLGPLRHPSNSFFSIIERGLFVLNARVTSLYDFCVTTFCSNALRMSLFFGGSTLWANEGKVDPYAQ